MSAPYYQDDLVTLFHGSCLEVTEWLDADVLVSDPPYGIGWRQGAVTARRHQSKARAGIQGDADTTVRDAALALWAPRPAVVFGSLMGARPPGAVQALVWHKPGDTGVFGSRGGWRRDAEGIYLVGTWPTSPARRSGVVRSSVKGGGAYAREVGHPHAKPVDLMAALIDTCPPGVVADPFAGAGSTLLAARSLGRRAIGVELEERYCELTARRLSETKESS